MQPAAARIARDTRNIRLHTARPTGGETQNSPPPTRMQTQTTPNTKPTQNTGSTVPSRTETERKKEHGRTAWKKETDKGFLPKHTSRSYNLVTEKTISPIKKQPRDLNRQFSKEDIQMANKHMKRCPTSLIITEVHIKTTMKYPLTPVRMAITNSRSLLRLMYIRSVMPSNHLILRCPLLLLPPIPPSIRIFSNESTLHMKVESRAVD